jgi:hypothetical protein
MSAARRCFFPLLATLGLGLGAPAAAVDPRADIIGRWAIDPADCANNRYVWRFTADHAGLLIDNRPVGRYYRAAWQSIGDQVVLSFGAEDGVAASFTFRFVKESEMTAVRIVLGGAEQGPPPGHRWRKCP